MISVSAGLTIFVYSPCIADFDRNPLAIKKKCEGAAHVESNLGVNFPPFVYFLSPGEGKLYNTLSRNSNVRSPPRTFHTLQSFVTSVIGSSRVSSSSSLSLSFYFLSFFPSPPSRAHARTSSYISSSLCQRDREGGMEACARVQKGIKYRENCLFRRGCTRWGNARTKGVERVWTGCSYFFLLMADRGEDATSARPEGGGR